MAALRPPRPRRAARHGSIDTRAALDGARRPAARATARIGRRALPLALVMALASCSGLAGAVRGDTLSHYELTGCPMWAMDGTLVIRDGRTWFADGALAGTEVAWPKGYALVGDAVVNEKGELVVTAGTSVHLPGGSNGDQFWACSPSL